MCKFCHSNRLFFKKSPTCPVLCWVHEVHTLWRSIYLAFVSIHKIFKFCKIIWSKKLSFFYKTGVYWQCTQQLTAVVEGRGSKSIKDDSCGRSLAIYLSYLSMAATKERPGNLRDDWGVKRWLGYPHGRVVPVGGKRGRGPDSFSVIFWRHFLQAVLDRRPFLVGYSSHKALFAGCIR